MMWRAEQHLLECNVDFLNYEFKRDRRYFPLKFFCYKTPEESSGILLVANLKETFRLLH